MQIENPLTVYLPDTRGVTVSRYGKGNLKIGSGVYTYSRLPGYTGRLALGAGHGGSWSGTCPGSTPECEKICYARRPVEEMGAVAGMWLGNSVRHDVPPIPADAKLLRLHVSGDFDTVGYVNSWVQRLRERPDVTCWVYTRSWRVPELIEALEVLRALPNVRVLASIDKSMSNEEVEMISARGWRRAWIDGDARGGDPQMVRAHMTDPVQHNLVTFNGVRSYVCPEETGRAKDCESCQYCFLGDKGDVTFLEH